MALAKNQKVTNVLLTIKIVNGREIEYKTQQGVYN